MSNIIHSKTYRNWVRGALGLLYVQKGLYPFTDRVVKAEHVRIFQALATCTSCTVKNIQPAHACGKACIYDQRNQAKCNCRKEGNRACNTCGQLYDEIITQHRFKDPLWVADASTWCTDHWQIAKCFMTTATQGSNNTAAETDVAGLLSIIINGNFFQSEIQSKINPPHDTFSQVRKLRNEILHNSTLELSDAEVTSYLYAMIAVLEDQKTLINDPSAKAAVKKLKKMVKEEVVTAKEETKAIQTAIDAIKEDKEQCEGRIRELTEEGENLLKKTTEQREENLTKLTEEERNSLPKQALQAEQQGINTGKETAVAKAPATVSSAFAEEYKVEEKKMKLKHDDYEKDKFEVKRKGHTVKFSKESAVAKVTATVSSALVEEYEAGEKQRKLKLDDREKGINAEKKQSDLKVNQQEKREVHVVLQGFLITKQKLSKIQINLKIRLDLLTGIEDWEKCFQMTDEISREDEAHKLLFLKRLPDQSQLETACTVFGRWSVTFFAICKAISGYIRTVSSEIIDVWAAYRYPDNQKCSNIVFVMITKTGDADIKVGDYETYERGQSVFSKESKEVMICVEKAHKSGYKFDETKLMTLENKVSENAEVIMNRHENLCVISPSVKKSKDFGTENASIFDELCISLYVHIKGLIPIAEEPFPTSIGDFPTDVLEDEFTPFHGGPFLYHKILKMGLAIHANAKGNRGNRLFGTLGGFLDHPSWGLCGLTCAHVVLSSDEMSELITEGCIDFSNSKKKVFQPVDSNARAFGEVLSARYCKGGNESAGMGAALFQICERLPINGNFPTAENFNDAGFDETNPMVYNTGKVCPDSQIRRRAEVYKYGITTGVTRGSLGFRGCAIRTTEASIESQNVRYLLLKQIEVMSIDQQKFASHGDSGALVFFDDKSDDSVAIGIVEGGQTNGRVFVTPICDILKKFDCPLNMKEFKQDGNISIDLGVSQPMDCDDSHKM